MQARPHSTPARATAGLIALVSLESLGLQWWDIMARDSIGPLAAIWSMARFFTILTHVLIVVTFARVALARIPPRAAWLAGLTLSILLVAVVYHLLLAGLRELSPLGQIADWGLHYITPTLVILWWLAFARTADLGLTALWDIAAWPALYCAYALTRGGIDGVFPYPFLDPLALGWPPVLRNVAELGAATVIGGLVMIGAGRLIARH